MAEDRPAADLSKWKAPEFFVDNGVKFPQPPFVQESLDKMQSGDITEFDVLITGYPRSGTSRLVEICWLLTHNCDVETAKTTDQVLRHMVCEISAPQIHPYDQLPRPRVAKTHVMFQQAKALVDNPQRKVIVSLRNPKDVLVSYYHFHRMNVVNGLFPGNWHQFFELYKQGDVTFGDIFDNMLSWWKERGRENILLVRYEEINSTPLEVVKSIADFLGESPEEEQFEEIVQWTTFSNMKEQPTTNFQDGPFAAFFKPDISPYMRSGKVGDWKNYFNEEENAYIDDLCEKRCTPEGLIFQFE